MLSYMKKKIAIDLKLSRQITRATDNQTSILQLLKTNLNAKSKQQQIKHTISQHD